MSADRFEIHDHGSKLTVRDTKYGSEVSMLRVRSYSRELTVMAGAIRQQARDLDQLRTDLAAAVAERDDYRDELSGLCHTLSVGSEGRPEMTAADWRKRVDQGIDFLTRPLLSRIEATDKELAKRSSMLDICTQNCSDWVGKWRAEQERAERAEARLAAIDGAPVVAKTLGNDHMHVNRGVARRLLIGTELIARPAKD